MRRVIENFKSDLVPKPAPLHMLKGAMPLQTVVQICLVIQMLVSVAYAMVFTILETYLWFPLMLLYLAEAGYQALQILDIYQRSTSLSIKIRYFFAAMSHMSLIAFLLFQDYLIDRKFLGQGISYHYWLFRIIVDIPIIFFNWSYYKHKVSLQQN